MKSKKLVIVLLALAIVTTLSAGTLAIYNTRLDSIAVTSVTAKQFVLTTAGAASQNFDIKLAPGESQVSEEIIVSNYEGDNVSEVPMDIIIAPTGSGSNATNAFFRSMPGATIELLDSETGNVLYTWAGSVNDSTDYETFMAANTRTDLKYKLRITWVDTDTEGRQGDYEGHNGAQNTSAENQTVSSFSLYIKATQSVTAPEA